MDPAEERQTGAVLDSPLTRRQALGALAAGTLSAGLGYELGVPHQAAQAKTSEFHGGWPYPLPPDGHYNTFILDGTALAMGIYQDLMEMSLAMYYWHSQTWLWLMATSGQFVGGDKYVVHLRKGAYWSDGSRFTSQDVLDTWTLWRVLGNDLFTYVDTITAPDDHTVVFHMRVPSTLVERYILHQAGGAGAISAPRASSVYGSWASRFRDLLAQGHGLESTEVNTLREQFLAFRPPKLVVNGPFQIDPRGITQGQMTLIRNPTSWAGNRVGFEKIVLYNGESAAIVPVVLAGLVDYATHAFSPAADRAFVKKGLTIITTPINFGFGIMPNFKKVPALRDKIARQALMYLIDRSRMGPAVEGKGGIPNTYLTGFSDRLVPQWLDRATLAKLNTYPHNPQKGISMLRGIGWTRGTDGIWVTPDGQRATWEILAEAEYADVLSCATNFAEQLAPHGFKLSTRMVTYAQAPTERAQGNFELTARAALWNFPHPYFAWQQDVELLLPPNTDGPGSGFDLGQSTADFGQVDLLALIDRSALGLDVERQRALVRKMARIYNDLVPFLLFVERYGRHPIRPGVRVAGWPALHDPIYLNNPYTDSFVIMMLLTGQLHAV